MTGTRQVKKPLALMLILIVGGVALDQITKALAIAWLVPGRPVPIVSDLLQFDLWRNPGAAFSTGAGLTVGFAVLALLVLIAVSVFVLPRVRCLVWAIAIGMGMAGVAGNFIDRLVRPPGPFRGYVIDFFSLKYFAIFNVADILLTAAAVLIVVIALWVRVDLSGEHPVREHAQS